MTKKFSTIRAMMYFNGPNLDKGIDEKGWYSCRWLDPVSLSKMLLRPNQHLVGVRYFTSRLRGSWDGERSCQEVYLTAIEAAAGLSLDIVEGHYATRTRTCCGCHHEQSYYVEKATDVNLVVALMDDAYDNLFDTAIIVSADSDLAPAISAVQKRYTNKRVIVAMPPGRNNPTLRQVAQGCTRISWENLYASQLPDDVITSWGTTHRVQAWKD